MQKPVTFTLIVLATVAGRAAAEDDLYALEEQTFQEAAAVVGPSVVRIQTVGGLDQVGRLLTGTGPTTGVVVSEDGYIISSSFNFISRPASILVKLPDGRRFPAEQVATDHLKMLTLLKIDAEDLTPAPVAPKDSFRVGQWALALGRTYDAPRPSVSVGIVSALNRVWGKAVQTDAKISPVNYGGPLIDIHGRVMGILVPLSPREDEETAGVKWYDSGIGFAIPLEDIKAVLDRLKSGEDLHPGLMGIEMEGGGLVTGKPVIDRVRVESPADQAGLQPGDRITEVDGRPVDRQAEVKQVLGTRYAGEQITVTIDRDGESLRRELTLVDELVPYESAYLGILPVRERIGESSEGVAVRWVRPDSPADRAGLKARDRIVRFNGENVDDPASLLDLVGRLRPDDPASLVYRRDGEEHTAEVQLASVPERVPDELLPSVIPRAGESNDGQGDDEGAPQTGHFTVEMPNHEHSYWAYVPDDYNPNYRYGLMVWIHPGGDTMEAAMLNRWKSVCDRRGLLMIGPKAADVSGWTLNESEFVRDAVDEFMQGYSVDPARVFVHGFSDGGRFAYHLAFQHRDLFRGVAAVAAPVAERPPENDPDFRLQFHVICGGTDDVLPAVRASVEALRQLKYPVSFRAVEEHGHEYPPEEALRELARWADSLDRI